jgi:hypothetical protein
MKLNGRFSMIELNGAKADTILILSAETANMKNHMLLL